MGRTRISPAPGYTTPVENRIRTMMKCLFPVTCANYDQATCNAFQDQWDDQVPNKISFTQMANACEDGWYRRR